MTGESTFFSHNNEMRSARRFLRKVKSKCDSKKFKGTMSALDVLTLQMDDMLGGSTTVAYKLASPANRRQTAPGYDEKKFEQLVNSPTYRPLLHATSYQALRKKKRKCHAVFDVLLYDEKSDTPTHGYRFRLSRQTEEEQHHSIRPYELKKDSQFWRTDSVLPIKEMYLSTIKEKIDMKEKMSMDQNVYGDQLNACSVGSMAMTGYSREGKCASVNGDAGKHHVCFKMDGEFCAQTNQGNWCAERMPCANDESKQCDIQNWCVCQWAFSDYVNKKTCDAVDIKCDATNMKALQAYMDSSEPIDKKAYECIKTKCDI